MLFFQKVTGNAEHKSVSLSISDFDILFSLHGLVTLDAILRSGIIIKELSLSIDTSVYLEYAGEFCYICKTHSRNIEIYK